MARRVLNCLRCRRIALKAFPPAFSLVDSSTTKPSKSLYRSGSLKSHAKFSKLMTTTFALLSIAFKRSSGNPSANAGLMPVSPCFTASWHHTDSQTFLGATTKKRRLCLSRRHSLIAASATSVFPDPIGPINNVCPVSTM